MKRRGSDAIFRADRVLDGTWNPSHNDVGRNKAATTTSKYMPTGCVTGGLFRTMVKYVGEESNKLFGGTVQRASDASRALVGYGK